MIVKETDVDFIGSIPVHWEVVPVKYFSTFRMGQTILKEDLIENFPRLGYRLKPLPELT